MKRVQGLLSSIISVLFPNICIQCKQFLSSDQSGFCKKCLKTLNSVDFPDGIFYANHQSNMSIYFDAHLSCFTYNNAMSQLIYEAKFKRRQSIFHHLANEMIHILKPLITNKDAIFIPVPISKKKHTERGFNQSEILAQVLSKYFKIPFSNKVLLKIKNNAQQSELSKMARLQNPIGVYQIKNSVDIHNKIVYLIDDVCATGSTLNECARMIKEHPIQKIVAVSLSISI